MGQQFSEFNATHSEVPEDVRGKIAPIDFIACDPANYQTGQTFCTECETDFGWWRPSTNCVWCGVQLCTHCCPTRFLLRDQPGCPECTKEAFSLRRRMMLHDHYAKAGVKPPAPVRRSYEGCPVPALTAEPAQEGVKCIGGAQ